LEVYVNRHMLARPPVTAMRTAAVRSGLARHPWVWFGQRLRVRRGEVEPLTTVLITGHKTMAVFKPYHSLKKKTCALQIGEV
jgi:hypothetical protein